MSPRRREHLDVVIVGAGISGVDAAYRIQTMCPGTSYAILEGRERMGGTWDLFRYPGVRSDSDMYTLAFPFAPWRGERSIAGGDDIRRYIEDTAAEHGITERIRFRHRLTRASWSSPDARWTLEVEAAGERVTLTCSFLYLGSGYYRYDSGYTPDFPGIETFRGEVVHPQFWPEDLGLDGRRIVVIGSGATAMTIVPALAAAGARVTMLQRSPSYVISRPSRDGLAHALRRVLPAQRAHDITRWKNARLTLGLYHLCRRVPGVSDRMLRSLVARALQGRLAVDPHFTPRYRPWDQRLCVIADADLFHEIRRGRVTVVTDTVDRVTEDGVRTSSGEVLGADVLVTATGLNAQLAGGIDLVVDGAPVDLGERVIHRGLMLDRVPNAAFAVGYTNASWTLRVDLSAQHFCTVIAHLDRHGYAYAYPVAPEGMETRPALDLSAGYVRRSVDAFPKAGTEEPWTLRHDYFADLRAMRRADVRAGMRFVPVGGEAAGAPDRADLRVDATTDG